MKHIVSRHRGVLGIESEEGKGSVFSVWLPQLSSSDGGAPELSPPAPPPVAVDPTLKGMGLAPPNGLLPLPPAAPTPPLAPPLAKAPPPTLMGPPTAEHPTSDNASEHDKTTSRQNMKCIYHKNRKVGAP